MMPSPSRSPSLGSPGVPGPSVCTSDNDGQRRTARPNHLLWAANLVGEASEFLRLVGTPIGVVCDSIAIPIVAATATATGQRFRRLCRSTTGRRVADATATGRRFLGSTTRCQCDDEYELLHWA